MSNSTRNLIIEVRHLSVHYGGKSSQPVLSDLCMGVERGESLAVLGPSGCGKTTLLHTIAGLHQPREGSIKRYYEDDQQALILQEIGLLPWKTVWKNAILGLQLRNRSNLDRARDLLDQLGLKQLKDKYPTQLSGGQQKRLALVRALAVDPEVLLMDEPLVSLDEFIREKLQNVILNLWQQNDLTLLLVTHDLEEASFLGRRVAIMEPTPAGIQKIIDNPEMGEEDFRRSDAYFSLLKELRGQFS